VTACSAPPDPLAGGEGAGCPLPKNTTPALGTFGLGLRASPLTQNRRLGPSQHDGLDSPMHSAKTTNQMYESSAGEPDADERGDELTEADAVGSLENVEILQDVRDSHQTQSASEPQTCTTNHAASLSVKNK